MAFKALGLNDRLVQGILATGYTAPTEIQARAIPHAIAGKDIIGCAQTGTGKTAAFVLPILNKIASAETKSHTIKSLILTPTRELAQQIEDAIRQYGRFMQLRTLSLYGGTSITNQLKKLHKGIDIVIATPGRLIDHLQRRSVDLSHIEVLVLDEADRMFDMGFIDDVERIIKQTPHTRQTLLFSATMSKEVRELVKHIQKHPELIEIGERRSPVKSVTQYFYSINEEKKTDLLLHILHTKSLTSVLVFSRTKQGADKISHKLEKSGIKSVSIHSDRTQAQRQRALSGFKQGKYNVLVATDVAARGIDVDGISHVINYDIPGFAEDYIHRIGRTGRASATGDAITFVARNEVRYLKRIESFTNRKFELKRYPDFDYGKAAEHDSHEKSHNEHSERRERSGGRNRNESRFGERRRDDRRSGFNRNEKQSDFRREDRTKEFNRDERKSGFNRNNRNADRRGDRKKFFDRNEDFSFNRDNRNEKFNKRRDDRRENFGRFPQVENKKRNLVYFPEQNNQDWRTLIVKNEESTAKKKKKIKKRIPV